MSINMLSDRVITIKIGGRAPKSEIFPYLFRNTLVPLNGG